MAQRVVDDLEAVQVDEQDAEHRAACARGLDGCIHALREVQAVGQAGERVAVGQLFNALLGHALLREVAHEADALHHVALRIAQRHPGQAHGAARAAGLAQPQVALPEAALVPLDAGQVAQGVGLAFGGLEQRLHRAPLHGHAAQQAFTGRVGACHIHVAVGNEDAVQAGLEDARGQLQARLGLGLGRDVAEGKDPPHGQAPAQLGHGAALQDAAVAQVQHVGRLHQGLDRQQLQLARIGFGIAHLAGQVVEDGHVVAAHQQRLGNAPERGKAVVEGADAAIGIADQDGVGRGLQRGAQLAQQALELGLVQGLLAPVQHADQ